MWQAVLLLETGALRTVYIPGDTAHEARRTVAGWIGRQHKDAVALVNLAAIDRTPRRRAERTAAQLSVLASMVLAVMLLLLLLFVITHP
jgi:hypothetical protein